MHESPLPHTRDMHGFSICSDSTPYPSNQRLRQIMHRRFGKRRVVRTWDRRDPAVRVSLSMGPAPDVLLGCCGGGRPWAPSRGRASRRREDGQRGAENWSLKLWRVVDLIEERKALKAQQWPRPNWPARLVGSMGRFKCSGSGTKLKSHARRWIWFRTCLRKNSKRKKIIFKWANHKREESVPKSRP
jgi:hypothetical protein